MAEGMVKHGVQAVGEKARHGEGMVVCHRRFIHWEVAHHAQRYSYSAMASNARQEEVSEQRNGGGVVGKFGGRRRWFPRHVLRQNR